MSLFRRIVRPALLKAGVDLIRFSPATHTEAQRKSILFHEQIEVFLDVGANRGQTGEALRSFGFEGRIISFEPTSNAFAVLKEKAAQDGNWEVHQFGLGQVNEHQEIHLSGNSASSSFLKLSELGGNCCPEARFVGQEKVETRTLDSVFPMLGVDGRRIYLKVDTQGYEKSVLLGALKSLREIDVIQLEMSLKPVYESEPLALELMNLLDERGYSLIATENGLVDPETAHSLQIDGVFRRRAA